MHSKLTCKILPLSLEPFIKTYSYNGFYLGILEAHNIDIDDLLLNEFFHIFYYRMGGMGHLDFTGSGFVEPERFYMKALPDVGDGYVDKIKEELDKDHYLMVNFNQKYISHNDVHYEYNHYHDWMIYGYSEENQSFFCAGYFGEQLYSSVEIPYCEVKNALINIGSFNKSKPLTLTNHISYINPNWVEKRNERKDIINKLMVYYFPPVIVRYHRVFIQNDINGIKKFIKAFYREHILIWSRKRTLKSDKIFLQDFRTYYEHKKVLQLAFEKITNNEIYIESHKNIVDLSYSCLLMALRYNFHSSKKAALRIYTLMLDIEEKEKVLFEYILKKHLPKIK